MIPGSTPQRIEDDHVERYKWSQRFAHGCSVVDIACGAGYGSALLAQAGATSVTGVDLSEEALSVARSRYATPRTAFEQGDITSWGAADCCDLVTSFETIEHLADTEGALSNLHRILKPGGILLISSPNRPVTSPTAHTIDSAPSNQFHVKEFTPRELRDSLRVAGFSVDRAAFGQRLQPPMPKRVQRHFARTVRPHERLSPRLRPLRLRQPRYFVLVGRKP